MSSGMEIPCKVTVEMSPTLKTRNLMELYTVNPIRLLF